MLLTGKHNLPLLDHNLLYIIEPVNDIQPPPLQPGLTVAIVVIMKNERLTDIFLDLKVLLQCSSEKTVETFFCPF